MKLNYILYGELLKHSRVNENKVNEIINEEIHSIYESKQTEQQALAYFRKNGVEDGEGQSLINQFKGFDTSKNQVNLPIIAATYLKNNKPSISDLTSVFSPIGDYMNSGKLKPIQYTKNGYNIGDNVYADWIKLSEYIHGLESMGKGRQEMEGSINLDTDEPPIWEGENIKVYDGNDVGKCIKYTTGGLTGQRYGFCIGQPANTMWQSYRDTKASTFYYIVDQNRDLSDPLHIVVFDSTQHGVELTDANNSTGNISEYDDDTEGYINYLKSKGVPTDKFVNKEKTPEEEEETAKIGSKNEDSQWFVDLSYVEKSKYIGRGHLLGDEQFKYLWQYKNDKGGYKLLNQYLDTGQAIPKNQFNILIGQENG